MVRVKKLRIFFTKTIVKKVLFRVASNDNIANNFIEALKVSSDLIISRSIKFHLSILKNIVCNILWKIYTLNNLA